MNKNVSEFGSKTELDKTFEYPGLRSPGNYMLLDGEEVVDVSEHPLEAFEQFDTMLTEKGLPLLADRIPVLAFGRNAGPAGLAEKTAKYDKGELSAEARGTVPMIRGMLHGHDVVWHGRPGQAGGYFAEMAATDETKDTDVEAWIQYLTPAQLAMIHPTEGETYDFSEINDIEVGDGVRVNTVGYTAREASLLLDADGQPISVSGVERSGSNRLEMNVRGALERTLGDSAVATAAGTNSPDQFIADGMAMKKLQDKKDRQARVQEAMVAGNMSRPYIHDTPGLRFNRADFDSLPRGAFGDHHHPETVKLMEQHAAPIRPGLDLLAAKAADLMKKFPKTYPENDPSKSAKQARKLLDPAAKIRERAHDELSRLEDPERVQLDEKRGEQLEALWRQGTIKKAGKQFPGSL